MNNDIKESIAYLHLPDGKVFELKSHNKVLTKEDEDVLMHMFGRADRIVVGVKAGISKERILILWGEVLKNSYITVEHY
jgi:hypothetical protein